MIFAGVRMSVSEYSVVFRSAHCRGVFLGLPHLEERPQRQPRLHGKRITIDARSLPALVLLVEWAGMDHWY